LYLKLMSCEAFLSRGINSSGRDIAIFDSKDDPPRPSPQLESSGMSSGKTGFPFAT